MKTVVTIEVIHSKPIPELANIIAGRAYTLDGVINAEPLELSVQQLEAHGFTAAEIALGQQDEVVRS